MRSGVWWRAWYYPVNFVAKALRIGLAVLGLGALCFAAIYGVYGGLGPCALPGQLELLLLGIGLTGIGALVCLISLPWLLIRRYRRRDSGGADLSLLGGISRLR